MKIVNRMSVPKFLYSFDQVGSTWTLQRHLVVKHGPKRIAIQLLPYDEFTEEQRSSHPMVYVNRLWFKYLGWYPVWNGIGSSKADGFFLNNVFDSKERAQAAVDHKTRAVSQPVSAERVSFPWSPAPM